MSLSSAAQALQTHIAGDDVYFTGCSTDSRNIKSGEMFIALRGEHFDGHDFIEQARRNGAVAAMTEENTGQSLPLLLVKDTRSCMGRLAGIWRGEFDLPVVAITGSNGKTTVKEMIANILSLQAPVLATRGNLNNDIGVPLTLFNMGQEHRFAVIEMGANHPGEIAYLSKLTRPYIALITQCAPAHLEGFQSVEGVARAKAEIFEGLPERGIAVINDDDEYAGFWRRKTSRLTQIGFGFADTADVTATAVQVDSNNGTSQFGIVSAGGVMDVTLQLPGKHNIQNALAAASCCLALDIPPEMIKRGLEKTVSSKGRLQFKKGRSGAVVVDDTYNANPVSLEAALTLIAGRGGRHWLVLGDMGELGPGARDHHTHAGETARKLGFERVYTVGNLSRNAADSFGSGARHFPDTESLIQTLKPELAADVTLLVKGSRAMAMENIVTALTEEDR